MRSCLVLLSLFGCCTLSHGDDESNRSADKLSLGKLQQYVGTWRGVGQLRRGSNKGAWIEQSDWAWSFSETTASLSFVAPKSKYFTSGELRPAKEVGQFRLTATTTAESQLVFGGKLGDEGQLVLETDEHIEGFPARITIRMIADGKRLIVLFEKKSTSSGRFSRLAEVGYTRKGSGFGKGTPFVECVVTGGKGTIPVTHDGKTYYVCCGGCRDLFNEDPVAALAEYRERKEAEQKKQ